MGKRLPAVALTLAWLHCGMSDDSLASAPALPERRPNIVFIMVDDLGKGPVGCYQRTEAASLTPHIDQLAANGLRLDNFYSMPQCTPTRVALLTGQYPCRNGWVNHFDVPRWHLKGFNPARYPCLGKVMKSSGYQTCIAGKWQINDFRREPTILSDCGFDSYCVWTGAESGHPPSDNRYWDPYLHTAEGSKTYHGQFGPDICNDFVCRFIENNAQEPFFVYYPMILVHGPLEQPPTAASELTPEGAPPQESPDAAVPRVDTSRTAGTDSGKTLQDTNIRYMDHLVGKVVAAIAKAGLSEQTLVIWTTDNGPRKGSTAEQGVCQPFVASGPGLGSGQRSDALVDITDLLPSFAEIAGATLPADHVIDGKSCAPLLLGKSTQSQRSWIAALGGGACHYDPLAEPPRVATNGTPYRDRVVRTQDFKLYIARDRTAQRLVRIVDGVEEGENLLASTAPEVAEARQVLLEAKGSFPEFDAHPNY
jgi:arylsulfatase A-like enzyme